MDIDDLAKMLRDEFERAMRQYPTWSSSKWPSWEKTTVERRDVYRKVAASLLKQFKAQMADQDLR
jgi:hypothetical protein